MEEDIENDNVQSDEDLNREMYALNEIMKRDILWNEKGGPQTPEELKQRELDEKFEEYTLKRQNERRRKKRAKQIETGYVEENPYLLKLRNALDTMEAQMIESERKASSN